MNVAEPYPATLQEMLRTRRVRGRTRELELMGDSTANNLAILASLLRAKSARSTLEVGLASGTSALLMADYHRGQNAGGHHHAIDPFQHELDDSGVAQIEREGLSDWFTLHREQSHVTLPRLLSEGTRFDLIYIDDSHLFEDVVIDVLYGGRLLNDGGVMLLDDSTWPDVAKVIAFVRANKGAELREIDLSPHRPDGGRSLRFRVARALGRSQMTGFERVGPMDRPWSSKMKRF